MEKTSKTALRAQVEAEVHNKRQCAYETYECSLLALDNFKYCIKHILKDKSAPFKQCNYIYQYNGKRCNLPAPKGEKKDYGYCNEHYLKTTLTRNKQNAKNPPPLTAETLLTNLSHYVQKPPKHISDEDGVEGDSRNSRIIDPFVDFDAAAVYNDHCNEVLDMGSESESDVEASTYSTVWRDANADSSDNESIDSEDEDPLKHANVYTADEITLLTRDKLVRLQSLYIEEYKHLRYLLKERRRKYLHSLKREKETCCNISNQVRDDPKEQRLYRKLKQYKKYHRSCGEEAILEKRQHDLRAKISDMAPSKTVTSKCQFTEGGVKCPERSLPLAKHCRKHILEDPLQVLFKACGRTHADIECNTPVEAIFDDSTCKLHMDVPLIRSYSHPRTSQGSKCKGKESESDPEDSLDLPHYSLPTNDNVKTQLMDYSLPSIPKMEMLPSILFEDSAESLSSTLQYSTSEFTESFADQNSMGVTESSTHDLNTDPESTLNTSQSTYMEHSYEETVSQNPHEIKHPNSTIETVTSETHLLAIDEDPPQPAFCTNVESSETKADDPGESGEIVEETALESDQYAGVEYANNELLVDSQEIEYESMEENVNNEILTYAQSVEVGGDENINNEVEIPASCETGDTVSAAMDLVSTQSVEVEDNEFSASGDLGNGLSAAIEPSDFLASQSLEVRDDKSINNDIEIPTNCDTGECVSAVMDLVPAQSVEVGDDENNEVPASEASCNDLSPTMETTHTVSPEGLESMEVD